jgi:uncharacterized protein YbaR (Trm112 family)/SAM-dependent methyltransferase
LNLPELIEWLACPVCKAAVIHENSRLVCSQCGRRYEITPSGVPVMLSDQSQKMIEQSLAEGIFQPPPQPTASVTWRVLRKSFAPPSPSLNTSLGRIRQIMEENLPRDATVLCLGGIRETDHWFVEKYRTIILDIMCSYTVAGDAHQLPFLDNSFDGVVLQAVLEHVSSPSLVVQETHRVLKKGGIIYVSVPFMQAYHYGPLDYQRYTITGLDTLLANFQKLESGVALGPSSALAWTLKTWIVSFSDSPRMRTVLNFLAGWLVFPIKFMDLYLARKKKAFIGAGGVYFVGTKAA